MQNLLLARVVAAKPRHNAQGRRIGQRHPSALLTDHEIELLQRMLDRREALRTKMQGSPVAEIWRALQREGLTLGLLAAKFEIHKSYVHKIEKGERRCQRPGG